MATRDAPALLRPLSRSVPGLYDPASLPLGANLAVFVAAAAVIWLAGTRLSGYAEAISERTGIGRAFIGALLLGGITSLPEGVTTVTASLAGHPDMAANNIFGGVAMQVAVLALADLWVRLGAISSVTRSPLILLQGNLLVLALAMSAGGIVVGEPAGMPVGLWTSAIFVVTVAAFWVMHRYEGHATWQPVMKEGRAEELERAVEESHGSAAPGEGPSLRRLVLRAALAAGVILVAGVVVTGSAEALAEQTGLGTSFVGVALLALSTSLPEISTTVAAARLGRFDMAFSNIFGANLLDVGLLFVTDVVAPGGPILDGLGDFSVVAALLAIVLTAVFMGGVVWRRVRTIGRLGVDSILVMVLYLAGLYALYALR